ncbi:hypothetical protein SAMN06265348_103120 [Pedobacter westerhofensis]|uniref:NACHT domain-containing protein n=1 Tax=Pedobacter westerhofensis TaxID=425512 RepID=A0A521BZY2_9SPHI|nr:hypothetical protein [Pedobacter westerhofensis]SMO52786.1 hypothetical protein SAMN06265348_103120 [Pedobacter westerhofensis]
MEYNNRLDELKGKILSKLGIRFITPADCKIISIEISKRLNKNVSETTIKRLFGFATVKHKFSTFTLTTLAEYVENVSANHNKTNITSISFPAEWDVIKKKADVITIFTLKTIRNRSGIPYDLTISRKFAEHDFVEFFNGDFIFTSFVSQPGYGKTILLSHLIENLFYKPNASYKNSSVLFIQASTFFKKDTMHLHIEEKLKLQMQIETDENVLQYINHIQARNDGKFFLVIDGFSELMMKKEDKTILYDSIINLICSLEDCRNIKLVMSMRSTTWTRFYDRMRHSSFLKAKWFPGNYFNLHELSNVPPLSEKEVEIIISKINYLDKKEINPRLKAQLKFPFHIQLYYQLKEEDPDFNYYTNITFYELVSRFIQEKIYRSNYYTEKILFLKKIIQLTGYGKTSNSVEKDSLIAELSAFRNAYMELLADGILMEEKRSEDAHPKEYVRFLHPHMFEYFLFVEILEKFHLQINKEFFNYINEEYDYNQVRFQLLQWATRFLIKTGNFRSLKSLFKLNLNSYETNYIILFIAEEIKYRSKYNNEILGILEEDKFHDIIISKLINLDFIDSCYPEAIVALVEIARNDEHLLMYYSILGVMEIIRLDKEGMRDIIKKLAPLDSSKWMINPADILEIILAKLNGEPLIHQDLLAQIDEFKKGNNPFLIKENQQMETREGVTYVLMLLVNIFLGDAQSARHIIENIVSLHPKEIKRKSSFDLYILSLYGIYGAKLYPGRKTDQIENIMVHLSGKTHSYLTKYQESLLTMFQAEQAYYRKEYSLAIDYAKDCLLLFKRNEVVLNAMFMFNLLISIYTDLENYDLVNEYKYEKLCLLDDQQVSRQLF